MKKKILYFLLLLLGNHFIAAQTLNAGDIAFIGYNTDSNTPTHNDDFTWIALKDIPAGEIIYFTDEGWTNQTNDWVGSTEAHLTWTSPIGGIACGTIINISEPNNDNVLVVTGGGTVNNPALWNLSSGDQILAYYSASGPAPSTVPSFLAGIHGDDGDSSPSSLDTITKWNDLSSISGGTSRSELPPGLTNGVNCVSLNPVIGTEIDNYKYTGTLTGAVSTIRAAINDRTNWSSDDTTPFDILPSAYSPSVFCVASCTPPSVPTVTYAPSTVCTGSNATLTITGNLNDATAWHIYASSCGGAALGTTTGSSFIVTPSFPSTSYYVRGEGGCIAPGSCGNVTVNVTADNASFSYGSSSYCLNDADPTPTITGLTGGVFTSSPVGLSINGGTGEIDVSTSTLNTYKVTYTTAGTCPDSSDVNVTISSMKDSTLNVNVCYNSTYTYADGTTSTNITANESHVSTLVGQAANGCDSVVTTNLTVEPTIDITVTNSSPTLTANQTGATYRWLDCGNGDTIIPSETSASFTASINGSYAVEIMVGNCIDTSACEAVTGVGIEEKSNQEVLIYPNPTSGIITIDLGSNTDLVNYSITTIDGKIVISGKTFQNLIKVDLSNESKGVYFLNWNDISSNNNYKIIKQ
ncbi:MAG: T9SS type A sorting domain-containing protein [Vicingus serpentipes]|nr:T9SS type A sorting domain-containing protein [Vicingus serpentipes]